MLIDILPAFDGDSDFLLTNFDAILAGPLLSLDSSRWPDLSRSDDLTYDSFLFFEGETDANLLFLVGFLLIFCNE